METESKPLIINKYANLKQLILALYKTVKKLLKLILLLVILLTIPAIGGWWSYHHLARFGTVIDGDTITAMYRMKPVKIRLSAINAPELYDYGHHVKQQCGQESKDNLVKLLNTKWLYLDIDGDDKDRYGRFIRAVYTSSLIDVQEEMINEGWAVPQYTSARGAVYHELHQEAMKAKRGEFNKPKNCAPLETAKTDLRQDQ